MELLARRSVLHSAIRMLNLFRITIPLGKDARLAQRSLLVEICNPENNRRDLLKAMSKVTSMSLIF